MSDPTLDAGLAMLSRAEDRAAREKLQRELFESALREVLSSPNGRLVLWELIDARAGVFGSTFSGERSHEAAYLEGRRSLGVEVMQECQRVAPSDWVHTLTEAHQRIELERVAEEKPHG